MRIILSLALVLFPASLWAQPGDRDAEIQAWREFTRQIEATGVEILQTYPQPAGLDRAEGLRYLLQQLSSSAEQAVVKQPDQISLLRVGATTINKWGMDGADAKYQGARISPAGRYRFSGQLGSARLFAMQIARLDGTYGAYAALTGDQLQADAAGRFEVLISATRPADWQGPWLELNPEADSLLVREYFSDWAKERPGSYLLERLDHVDASPPLTAGDINALLATAADTFASRTPQWQSRVDRLREHLQNRVIVRKADEQGLASNFYGSGWFNIGDDQALVIEMDAPDALLWSVQLGNVWWESLDYINRTASYNDSQAVVGSDGKYRFVISQRDPGVPNWLDPAGHSEGTVLFRQQDASAIVNPVFTLVPFAELARHLPADTPQVGAEQRRRAIEVRRRHAGLRWAP